MTFLETRLNLTRKLDAADFDKFRQLSTEYGIRGLALKDGQLAVEFDASRIHEAEVIAQVRLKGIPAALPTPIAPGAFDYNGEFKDYAWPTEGLTPVNAQQK